MIAVASGAQCGVENLWQRSRPSGRRDHANFGRCVRQNYFKALTSADLHYFGDKSGGMMVSGTNHGTCSFLA